VITIPQRYGRTNGRTDRRLALAIPLSAYQRTVKNYANVKPAVRRQRVTNVSNNLLQIL